MASSRLSALLLAVIAVVIITADAEISCALEGAKGAATWNTPGACPPVKVTVPYPGFSGNYGVEAMYEHTGKTEFKSNVDGSTGTAPVYITHVMPSRDHPTASILMLRKANRMGSLPAWSVTRKNPTSQDTGVVVSHCTKDVTHVWECGGHWEPPLEVAEMDWGSAHKEDLKGLKSALRYAQALQGMPEQDKTTGKLKRAANAVQIALEKVHQVEANEGYKGEKWGGKMSAKKKPKESPIDKLAETAAVEATMSTKQHYRPYNDTSNKAKVMNQTGSPPHNVSHSNHSAENGTHKGDATRRRRQVVHDLYAAVHKSDKAKKKESEIATRKRLLAEGAAEQKKVDEAAAAKQAVIQKVNVTRAMSSIRSAIHKINVSKHVENTIRHSVAKHIAHHISSANSSAHAAHTHLKIAGVTPEKMNDPHFRDALIKTAAKALGVNPAQVTIVGQDNAVSSEKRLMDLMQVSDIDVTFEVKNASTGHLQHFHQSVAQGQFDDELKKQAHAQGVEVTPHAIAVNKTKTAVVPSPPPLPSPAPPPLPPPSPQAGVGRPALGSATKKVDPNNGWMPGRYSDQPAPGALPTQTRWDAKGKTGKFTRCASAPFGGKLELKCPRGTKLSRILYADLGQATGPWCGWETNPACSFPDAIGLVEHACLGKTNCIFSADLSRLAVASPHLPNQYGTIDKDNVTYGVVSHNVPNKINQPTHSGKTMKQLHIPDPTHSGKTMKQLHIPDPTGEEKREAEAIANAKKQEAQKQGKMSHSSQKAPTSQKATLEQISRSEVNRAADEAASEALRDLHLQDLTNSKKSNQKGSSVSKTGNETPEDVDAIADREADQALKSMATFAVESEAFQLPESRLVHSGEEGMEYTDSIIVEAVEDAVVEATGDPSHAYMRSHQRKILKASLINEEALEPVEPEHDSDLLAVTAPGTCWVGDGGKLVVRAECEGTMEYEGLETAPSMALGKVTIAGLPKAQFDSSYAYKESFQKAVEAAMCHCSVNVTTCINDKCAGNVEIQEVGGDEHDTDIMFRTRVPPTMNVEETEKTLSEEMHSASALYAFKEGKEKVSENAEAKTAYHLASERERQQKIEVRSEEKEDKKAHKEEEEALLKRQNEQVKKQDANKYQIEKKNKELQAKAEHAQDVAASASEKSSKASLLHEEARAKSRAAKELLDKKARKAKEVYTKTKAAEDTFTKGHLSERNIAKASVDAKEKFNEKNDKAVSKVKAVEELRASMDASADGATHEGQPLVLIPLEQTIEDPVRTGLPIELLAVRQAMGQPTFVQNFIDALHMDGVEPPDIGTSVDFWKAQQASAASDNAQMGLMAPAPTPALKVEDDDSSTDWLILLLLLLLSICGCYYCYQPEREHNPHYTEYEDTPADASMGSMGVDSNGLPVMGGNHSDPIGSVPGYQGSRTILSSFSTARDSNVAPGGVSSDPRREHQKKVVVEELANANRELEVVPWYKRQAVKSRIGELEKWKAKLEDESRPMYMSQKDRSINYTDPRKERAREESVQQWHEARGGRMPAFGDGDGSGSQV